MLSSVRCSQDKREKQDKLADSNLYIKNLDDGQTDDTLRQLFEVRGPCLVPVGAGISAQASHPTPHLPRLHAWSPGLASPVSCFAGWL